MTVLFRCTECGTVVFEIDDGCVVIRSRHHGEKHQTRVPITKLVELNKEQEAVRPERPNTVEVTNGHSGGVAGSLET